MRQSTSAFGVSYFFVWGPKSWGVTGKEGCMEEQDVASRLAQDIEANMAVFQIGGIVAGLALAIIGAVLSMRAYAVLSEARALYWQASALASAALSDAGARSARAAAIKATGSKKKIKSNRVRGIM